jgi:hypothetical protein
MPTPESAEAFAKLVAARQRFVAITKQLAEANAQSYGSGEARQRCEELQKEWEQAFHEFQEATGEYSVIVKKLHENAESNRSEWAGDAIQRPDATS